MRQFACTALAFVCIGFAGASAQGPTGQPVTISTGSGQDELPDLDISPSGITLVAWHDQQTSTIRARRYDASGAVMGATVNVGPTNAPGQDSHPSIVWSGQAFLVTWDRRKPGGGDWDIWMARIPEMAGGPQNVTNLSSASFGASDARDDRRPDIGAVGLSRANPILVAFERTKVPGDRDLYVFVTSPTGSLSFTWVANDSSFDYYQPAVVKHQADPNEDDTGITWVITPSNGTPYVVAERIENIDAPNGPSWGFNCPCIVSNQLFASLEPDIAGDDPEFLVTWNEQPFSGGRDIRARYRNLSGNQAAYAISSGTQDDARPCVSKHPTSGNYLVAWARQGTGNNYEIVTREVTNAAAGTLGSPNAINTSASLGSPQFAYDPSATGCDQGRLTYDSNGSGGVANSDVFWHAWDDGNCVTTPPTCTGITQPPNQSINITTTLGGYAPSFDIVPATAVATGSWSLSNPGGGCGPTFTLNQTATSASVVFNVFSSHVPGTYSTTVTWTGSWNGSCTGGQNTYTETITVTITGPTATLSITPPSPIGIDTTATFYLSSDPIDAGRPYVLALSGGNSPGLPISGSRTVPLNPDWLFFFSFQSPSSPLQTPLGMLDASGNETCVFQVPDVPALLGQTIHAAFVVIDPQSCGSVLRVSNGLPVTF